MRIVAWGAVVFFVGLLLFGTYAPLTVLECIHSFLSITGE